MDANEEVSKAAKEMLLPVIGVWSLELGKLQSQLFAPFLKSVESVLKVCILFHQRASRFSAYSSCHF